MSLIQNRSVVKASPSKIGTSGCRLSDTDSGKAPQAPKTRAKRERTVLQGLKGTIARDIDLDPDWDDIQAWCDEYEATRKERVSFVASRRESMEW